MRKTTVSAAFLFIFLCPLFAVPSYFIYDRPSDYTESDAQNLMLEANEFKVDGQTLLFDPDSPDYLSNYGSKVVLRAHDKPVFRGVPVKGAEELNQVFIIDGPANIRITPIPTKGKKENFYDRNAWQNPKKWDGRIIGSMADNILVYAAYKYGDWYFVYDRNGNTGWTNKTNLKPIPPGKMYFYNEIKDAPGYFAAWKEEDKAKIDKIFDMFEPDSIASRGMTIEDVCFGDCSAQSKNKPVVSLPAGKKQEDFCPKFISPFEKDGFVSTVLPFDTSAKKSYIWRYCHGQDPQTYVYPSRQVTNVRIKTDKCICLDGELFWDTPSYVEFTKDEPFYDVDDKGNKTYDCVENENTIICNISCTVEDNPGCPGCDATEVCYRGGPQKICPKECMEWQPAEPADSGKDGV